MSRKHEKEEIIFFTLFCHIAGIVLVAYGYWWALILVGMAFYFTLLMSPTVRNGTKATLKAIGGFIRRRTSRSGSPSAPTHQEMTVNTSEPKMISDIIQRVNAFPLSRMPQNEKACEDMLVSYLQAFYPQIRRQEQYPDMRIDAVIDKTGIEIKFQPTQNDFHMLYSQIEDRLQFLDEVIVIVFSERDKQATAKFAQKLKLRGWLNNTVFVVTKN